MNVLSKFDASGLGKGLNDLAKECKKADKVCQRSGYMFAKIAKQVSREHAPTAQEIEALPSRYGNRILRRHGVTVAQEIQRRISKIGLLARNWRFWKLEQTGSWSFRAWIIDNVSYSKTVDDSQHLVDQAKIRAQPRFMASIERFRDALFKKFNG